MQRLPIYVYLLFGVLVYVGLKRCFPREVRPVRPIVFPVVFVGLGIASLGHLFPRAGDDAYAAALAALMVGAAAGWLHARRWRLQFRHAAEGMLVRLPGDASLLVMLLLTFVAETLMHYAIAASWPWAASGAFAMLSFSVWGVLVGMPLGRAINVITRCLRYADGSFDEGDSPSLGAR
ncbi:hypothetical protein [Burkholderia pseudomultivorans]|uniref:Membrane protein n=1 Tax=Burkholderia pseudomultivorans TaxID=1207504 RepID=A0A6P2PX94_9BURK|nr:hypothetical protein [Burkholderia pseudomultivorans]MDR8727153.1 hypothetical protein [Burkholderia pseudomultivorans]MDR8733008.1 hypothetical protein [Burkholderia pseudomultivorans]MDR8739874.1 hypothetical protein [Burkholderia pseudomultivorans]MDR8756044.1 hypothetical protein [Burkholderia pseudomultivorans]MDR8775980.1 hypothetical protein [Burkholderia pseudomultivorans]